MATVAERRSFLGGSDAAAVLGVSSWTTPYELWAEKVKGVRKPVSEAILRARRRGTKLEPFIRAMTLEKLADEGHDVKLVGVNQRYQHPEHPFLAVEIDFEVEIDGELVNADAKSVSGYARNKWGEVGTDAMPIEYAAQFMQGLDIAPGRRRRTLVAALRSFDDVDIYWLQRDDETIAGMREKLVSFWLDHVVPKVPPDPVKFSDLRSMFAKPRPLNIAATDTQRDQVARLKAVATEKLALEREEEELRFQLARYMGKHALLTDGVRDLISWDNQTTKRFDLKAFTRDHPDWVALYSKETTGRVLRFASRRG